MSNLVCPLHSSWEAEIAILKEKKRLVIIRFGHAWDMRCMDMDKLLASVARDINDKAVIYQVDILKVPDFNGMYELSDPCTTMFFFQNNPMMVDLGTANNEINWAVKDKQKFIKIVESVYKGAWQGRVLHHVWQLH